MKCLRENTHENKTHRCGLKLLCFTIFFIPEMKKSSSLNGRAIKEKNNFFEPFFATAKISAAIMLEGERGVRP